MAVTDQYRLVLLDKMQDASPTKLKIIESELDYLRDVDGKFLTTERWTLAGAGGLAVVMMGVAVFFGVKELEAAASITALSDIAAVATLLIRRSFFINKVE